MACGKCPSGSCWGLAPRIVRVENRYTFHEKRWLLSGSRLRWSEYCSSSRCFAFRRGHAIVECNRWSFPKKSALTVWSKSCPGCVPPERSRRGAHTGTATRSIRNWPCREASAKPPSYISTLRWHQAVLSGRRLGTLAPLWSESIHPWWWFPSAGGDPPQMCRPADTL